jgi:hypothetical protein
MRTDRTLLVVAALLGIYLAYFFSTNSTNSTNSTKSTMATTTETTPAPVKANTEGKTEKQLAAAEAVKNMSTWDYRKWNKLADGMSQFHSKFEWEFNHVYEVGGAEPGRQAGHSSNSYRH